MGFAGRLVTAGILSVGITGFVSVFKGTSPTKVSFEYTFVTMNKVTRTPNNIKNAYI
jgi:hypothetical protein